MHAGGHDTVHNEEDNYIKVIARTLRHLKGEDIRLLDSDVTNAETSMTDDLIPKETVQPTCRDFPVTPTRHSPKKINLTTTCIAEPDFSPSDLSRRSSLLTVTESAIIPHDRQTHNVSASPIALDTENHLLRKEPVISKVLNNQDLDDRDNGIGKPEYSRIDSAASPNEDAIYNHGSVESCKQIRNEALQASPSNPEVRHSLNKVFHEVAHVHSHEHVSLSPISRDQFVALTHRNRSDQCSTGTDCLVEPYLKISHARLCSSFQHLCSSAASPEQMFPNYQIDARHDLFEVLYAIHMESFLFFRPFGNDVRSFLPPLICTSSFIPVEEELYMRTHLLQVTLRDLCNLSTRSIMASKTCAHDDGAFYVHLSEVLKNIALHPNLNLSLDVPHRSPSTVLIKTTKSRRRWLEKALGYLCFIQLCLQTTSLVSELKRVGLSSDTIDGIPYVRHFTSHWRDKSPSLLAVGIKQSLCDLCQPGRDLFFLIADLLWFPTSYISCIYDRLVTLNKKMTSEQWLPTYDDKSLIPQCRTSILAEILSLRLQVTCKILLSKSIQSFDLYVNVLKKLVLNDSIPIQPNTKGTLTSHLATYLYLLTIMKRFCWNFIVDPILKDCPSMVLEAVCAAIHPPIIRRIKSIVGDDQRLLYVTLFRMFCSMHFEPLCVIESKLNTSDTCCHTYLLSPSFDFLRGQPEGHYKMRSRNTVLGLLDYHLNELACNLWLITGVWPSLINDHIRTWSLEQLWTTAVFYKEWLLKLLFDHESDTLRDCLIVLSAHHLNHPFTDKVWLPRRQFTIFQNSRNFMLSWIFVVKVIDLLRIYPASNEIKFRLSEAAALMGMPIKKLSKLVTVRWFLRHLEPSVIEPLSLPSLNISLGQIWCHSSEDIYHPSSFDAIMQDGIRRVVTQIRKSPHCRDRFLIDPSIYFLACANDCNPNSSFDNVDLLLDQRRLLVSRDQLAKTSRLIKAVHDNTAVKDESEKPPDGAQNDHLTSNDDNVHNKGGTNSSLNELNMTSDSLMEDPHCKTRAPQYFSNQLQQLKEICDAEAVRAQLGIMERRCRDLESRISEANEELARVRAEGRATEASLSAARRTEAALRRRLLVAMDVQGSGTGSNRYSMGATLNGAIDTRSPVELEAALIKYEAINNSLTEAAQLDRTRLHEQSLHIGQLEAERRTLYDRISTLQATEAGAQRGIVRLQALYEDMLREYSESRTQEMTLRSRERSQSNYRNKVDQDKNGQCTNKTRPHSTMNNLQERITKLEKENTSLKQALQLSEQNRQHPIGPCSFPACIKVRQLLQAFQDRFSNVVTQLCETRSYLDKQNFNRSIPSLSTNVVQPGDHKCINLVQSVRQQLVTLLDQVVGGQNVDDLVSSLTSCSATLQRLESWLQTYLDRTDTEVLQLREIILGLQVCEGEQTLETHCTDHVSRQPFSCSIRVNKKPNMDLLSQKEHEIVQLRRQIRELETDALVGGQNNMN